MNGFRDFTKFGRSAFEAVFEHVGRGMGKVQEHKELPHDLLENEDTYLVVFDAPGATQSDIQVRFLDREVQVQIDRFREFYEGYEMRFPGRGLSLDGTATLPADAAVDPGEASAELRDNGTLYVRIPKTETTVDVTVEGAESEGEELEGAESEEETLEEETATDETDADGASS